MRVLENIEVSLAGCENSLPLLFAQNHEDIPYEEQNTIFCDEIPGHLVAAESDFKKPLPAVNRPSQ